MSLVRAFTVYTLYDILKYMRIYMNTHTHSHSHTYTFTTYKHIHL